MNYSSFQKFSYGMYIVSSAFEGKKAGYIGNTVFQVTSEPPRVAISCHKNNDTLSVILRSKSFAVSVMNRESDTALIAGFGFMSSSEFDKFANVNHEIKKSGAPVVLSSCIAWRDCRMVDSLDLGTHLLIVGEVIESGLISEGEPLTYDHYRIRYKMSAPRKAPTYIDKIKLEAREVTTAGILSDKRNGETPVRDFDKEQESYICSVCSYIYNPANGDPTASIPPGTPFGDLPEDYRCPVCNAGKDYFSPLR